MFIFNAWNSIPNSYDQLNKLAFAGRIDCNKTERFNSQKASVLKKCSDVSESDELSLSSHRKEITITIESIENIDYCHIKEILVKIEFLGEVLAQSEPISVLRKNFDIGLTATINAVDINSKFIDDILGNPVVFKILECNTGAVGPLPPQPPSSVKTEKDNKKKVSKASGSVTTASKSEMTVTTLGVSNIDLRELVIGKRRIREVLNVESDKTITIPESTHWANFPRLVVVVCSGDEKLIPDSVIKYSNIIGITVESVYNLPSYIATGTLFDAIIPVPSLENKANNLVFPSGEVVNEKAVDNRKRWLNLLQIDGPGGKSKHEIPLDSSDIFNPLTPCYELEKGFNNIRHLIQWNMWRNCLMVKADSSYFFSKLMKYKTWPIEIIVANKPPSLKTPKSDKKSKPAAPEAAQNSDRFVAFLNLSSFLYPGVTKVRVASQLYTYSQSDLINKFGAEFAVPVPQASVATVKSKATSERQKALPKEPENKSAPGSPVYNEEGLPVFIIVEVELWKPFTPKKDPEFLEKQLKSYVCLKGRPKKKEMNLVHALDNFSETIKDVVSVLSKEYYHYIQLTKKDEHEDESFVCFLNDFLYRQENFQKVRNSLGNKIIALIAEKYGRLSQYNEMLPEIYVYLVEEMHKITNNFVLGQSDVLASHYNTDELQLYAEEALEEDEYELAREYLLLKLSRDKSNAEYWLDYAVFCIKIQDYETAIETVREVLFLDINNRMGLLLYALLMTKVSQGAIAEMTFQTLLTKYPDFIEGWMVLHLFYITVKSTEGEDVSFQMVMKLENEARFAKGKEDSQERPDDEFFIKNYSSSENGLTRNCKYGVSSYVDGNSWNQPLSWTTLLCPANSATVRTAVLMLQLGFYGNASMALAKSLVLNENPAHHPPHYFYYQAICYYLEDFYDEALSQLEVPIRKYGKDCSIWGLMGHCFYKLNDVANAIACYEYVLESYNRPDDIHLIYSRMGSFYLKTGKYVCAKKVFTIACKYSPTPRLWMGAGIACLRLGEYEEAETAFSEANYLDNRNSETWAYLALVNALLQRVELSRDCYAEARKRNLTNENLKEEVESCLRQYNWKVGE